MSKFLPIIYYIYAVALVGGGAMGSMKSHKPSSIIGSLVFGAIAVAAGVVLGNNPRAGLIIGLIDAVAVVLFFIYRYMKTQSPMPAFPAIGMSVIVLGLTIAALTALGKTAPR